MRLIAKVESHPNIKRLMIHQCNDGVYLFLFEIEEDGGCSADLWFQCLDDAFDVSAEDYGVRKDEWEEISDPLENCQQDWIAPARVPGRESGKPEWGKLEVLQNGKWTQIMG